MWQPGHSGGGMAQRRKHPCPECGREVSVNVNGRVRVHADLRGPKLTETQLKILRNLRDYPDREPLFSFHGMAQRGGASRALYKLVDKGLVGKGMLSLTEAGEQALADCQAKTQ